MQYILSKDSMQGLEAYTMNEIGIPSIVLMERAALCIEQKIKQCVKKDAKILVVVEGGNNGADGVALARMLTIHQYDVFVYYVGQIKNKTEAFVHQWEVADKLGVKMIDAHKERFTLNEIMNLYQPDVIVDGLFGIGLSRDLSIEYQAIIRLMNMKKSVYRIAIDIPSGLYADRGEVAGACFMADVTVTMGCAKPGLYLNEGFTYAGEVFVADIGFPVKCFMESGFCRPNQLVIETMEHKDLGLYLPKRVADGNKGNFGRIAIFAGSKDMSGAAFLSAKAAYLMGAGLVKIYTHESNRVILQTLLPEAVMMTYEDEESMLACVTDGCNWADSIVLGPGIGKSDLAKQMVKLLCDMAHCPFVVDADALNIIAEDETIHFPENKKVVITPHMKEFSRLTGQSIKEMKENRFELAKSYAKEKKVICVLKDHHTVISDGGHRMYLNQSGNNGMATGGSGDVLTGIIATLLASDMNAFDCVKTAVYLHGLAADVMSKEKTTYSLMAGDLHEGIVKVLGGIKDEEVL